MLLLIKIIVNYYYVNNNIKEMFLFLYYSWPELVRIIFKSRILNKNYLLYDEIDEKILNKLFTMIDNCTYNLLFTFNEKVFILEKLIQISLDSVFIRSFLKETQEKRLSVFQTIFFQTKKNRAQDVNFVPDFAYFSKKLYFCKLFAQLWL